MVISIQHDSDTAVTLIDGPDRSSGKTCGPADLSGSAPIAVQPRQALRATYAKPLQRAGAQHPIRFSGARLNASAAAARSWLFTHLDTVPRDNKLIMVEGAVTVTIADAVLQDIGYKLRGATVFLEYILTGGGITIATT
jgi:hypothetical protein